MSKELALRCRRSVNHFDRSLWMAMKPEKGFGDNHYSPASSTPSTAMKLNHTKLTRCSVSTVETRRPSPWMTTSPTSTYAGDISMCADHDRAGARRKWKPKYPTHDLQIGCPTDGCINGHWNCESINTIRHFMYTAHNVTLIFWLCVIWITRHSFQPRKWQSPQVCSFFWRILKANFTG